ncbi:hypothetical protein BDZ45DRAFT_747915 [Acephala macrosclerotiorum]|nr:hypothetical protein BDZ45DRAFT_747915 [Acephala macrosclerotiorum]
MYFAIPFLLFALTHLSHAICPGFNLGFLNNNYAISLIKDEADMGYTSSWSVVLDDCSEMYGCDAGNPCGCSHLACTNTGANTYVDRVSIQWAGGDTLWYLCRPDVNSGSCMLPHVPPKGSFWQPVESCCRNDGKRNFEEGRISEREYHTIEETNAMLDIHLREYEAAVANGTHIEDMEALRVIQRRELKWAEGNQLVARGEDRMMKKIKA